MVLFTLERELSGSVHTGERAESFLLLDMRVVLSELKNSWSIHGTLERLLVYYIREHT